MAARRAATTIEAEPDLLGEAMAGDREKTATELAEALEYLGSITDSTVKAIVYKLEKNGKWGFVKEMRPPIDSLELMDDLQRDYGPGEYPIRIMAGNRIMTTKSITIAGSKQDRSGLPRQDSNGMGGTDMLRLVMEQTSRSRDDQGDMFKMMMAMMQNSNQQTMQAMQHSSAQMMTLVTAIMAKPSESPTAVLAQLADINSKMNPDKSHSLTETVETLKVLKDFAGGGDGGSEKDFFGRAMDALPALMEGVGGMMRGGGLPMVGPAQPQSFNGAPPAPMVTHAPSMLVEASTEPEQPIPPPSNRVLAIIKDDVLFYFKRQSDPEFAAEGIVNTLMQNEVTQDELSKLIVQFQSSPDLLGELAAQGIDLRSNPVWVNITLAQVVSEYSARLAEDNDSGGKNGGDPDPSNNGTTG